MAQDIDEMCQISPIPGLSWEEIEEITSILTLLPLGTGGHRLNDLEVGVILGTLLRGGYTIVKVGPT